MAPIHKLIGVVSCSVFLGLSLSNAAQADSETSVQEEMKADQTDRRQGGQEVGEKRMSDETTSDQSKSAKTIMGEALRLEAIHIL